jgi:hypothetical protein
MNCLKHVEFHIQNKFEKISASSWFYCKEIGHGMLQNHDINQPGITAVGKVLCLAMQAGAPLP